MPLRWRSRRRFDGIAAGERSLAGQEETLDPSTRIVDNASRMTTESPIQDARK